jgi:hypothetical protein
MAYAYEVLTYLIPDGGWVQTGEEYEKIQFITCEPITKAQYEAGFAQYDAWKAQRDATKAAAKQAILNKLGITAEEAALLLGGTN